ncbi:hypothetical protein PS922_00874 [Pseudomonas fluorescens]|uniref:Uncharacterized protein n=1 Tax=Pseudomonas fluorescens TaxID=294 RepID=A0A5E7RC04_PSEFL|nr:hypothetical protein PS922_00874 [Pseudomonas fluorescens]
MNSESDRDEPMQSLNIKHPAATLLISVFGWMADRSSYSKLEEGYRSYTYFQSKPSTANSIVRLPSL